MPKFLKNLLTFLLAIVITIPSLGIVEAKEVNAIQDSLKQSEYAILETSKSSYGDIYYVVEKSKLRERAFWDVVDVLMAGASWADFFKDPSWKNLGWAVLDTASILPLLPSTAYVRKGGKILLKIDEVAKFAKTTKGKAAIKSAMKIFTYADGITTKAITAINKTFKNKKEASEVIEIFKKAANKGFVGATGESGIKKLNGVVEKIYTHEIKVKGKYGAYRIFGYKDASGNGYSIYLKKHISRIYDK